MVTMFGRSEWIDAVKVYVSEVEVYERSEK